MPSFQVRKSPEESIGDPHHSADSEYVGLLEKLEEDRFGFSETLVKGMIEALPNAESCMGYKTCEQKGIWRANDSDVSSYPQSRFRAREKARRQRKAPESLGEEQDVAVKPVANFEEVEVIAQPPLLERRPPPAGQPLTGRLPPQLVGDVLQIWEFLSRFAEVIGQIQPPLLEDLEEGLICGAAIGLEQVETRVERCGKNDRPEADPIVASDGHMFASSSLGAGQLVKPASSSSPVAGQGPQQGVADGLHAFRQQDESTQTPGNVHVPGGTVAGLQPESLNAKKSTAAKLVVSSGFATAASVHIPLLNYLLSDLLCKVCGPDEVQVETEESRPLKRGRKRVRDTVIRPVLGREKLSESFSLNEWTWPEIARRYMISVSRLSKLGEIAEDNTEECLRILRCIQGDGGVLCGALDGVAGMEVDAQLLAEAEKELSAGSCQNGGSKPPITPPETTSGKDSVEDGKASDGETARWVKILDPIAKLPTNVGSRIRNRVRDALEAEPPDWAVELLELSISKEVYKGNASGPTKRLVMEVLSRYYGEDPKIRESKKVRKRVFPSPEVVMQRCRIVLRQVAAADKEEIVSNGIGSIITNFYESDGDVLLARPLDFRAIDLRLGAGAYGTLPAAFAADVRQIWKNVQSVYGSDSEEQRAMIALSELFEALYSKQVVIFQGGVDNAAPPGPDGKGTDSSGEVAAQNLTGEQPSGQDAGEPVKAPWEDDSCQICGIDDDHDNVLLCDGCDAEYHIYCLNPPLPKVPEGNWYCSSCVAVDKGFLEPPSAVDTAMEAKTLDKQEKLRSEDAPEKEQVQIPDSQVNVHLQALAMKLAETDYWHLSLSERVCLLKCLCDQALETLKLRIHVEETMDVAMELQQKLRNLLAERQRYIEYEEARLDSSKETTFFTVLQTGAAKTKGHHHEYVSEIGQKGLLGSEQSVAAVAAGPEGSRDFIGNGISTNFSSQVESTGMLILHQQEDKGEKDLLKNEIGFDARDINCHLDPESRKDSEVSKQESRSALEVCVKPTGSVHGCKDITWGCPKVDTSLVEGCLRSTHGSEIEGGKASLRRRLCSPLDTEIEKVMRKLKAFNIRRDLLGKDDHGREYWALFGSKMTPWLAVDVVEADNQFEKEDILSSFTGAGERLCGKNPSLRSFEILDKGETRRMLGDYANIEPSDRHTHLTSEKREGIVVTEIQRKRPDEHWWYVYSDGDSMDQLIGWLLPTSSDERALKSTLLQWRSFLLLHEGVRNDRFERSSNVLTNQELSPVEDLASKHPGGNRDPDFPFLRASRLLELKYGRFNSRRLEESWTPVAAPKRGRKKKMQMEMSRCKCLEPIWMSRCHCMVCHTTFESAVDLELHTKEIHCSTGGAEGPKSTGKRGGQSGKHGLLGKTPQILSPDKLAGVISLPPDVSTMPFIIHESIQDSVNQIGLIACKEPTFAPGLSVAPAFDPSLMIFDATLGQHPLSLFDGAHATSQQLLDTLAVGGTSCFSYGNVDDSRSGPGVLVKSSEGLPGALWRASKSSGSASATVTGESLCSSEKKSCVSKDSAMHANPDSISNGFPSAGNAKASGRLIQVTGKQLVISEAALHPLQTKDLDLLRQLKIKLLDIEAVLTSDMLELGRASSGRRQSWRSFVKAGKSIYGMVQATILLEQMVCADFLKSSWCYWTSFSAAAKTATLSSLFFRVYALDASLLYENSESYTGLEMGVLELKQGKREREGEDKKGCQSMKVAARKKRKEDMTT